MAMAFGFGFVVPATASGGGDEPQIEVRAEEGMNEVELEGAMVTAINSSDTFTVSILGHMFTVKTNADTEFKDVSGVSGLTVGDTVDVEGSFNMHHKIIADEVELEEADELEDADEDNSGEG